MSQCEYEYRSKGKILFCVKDAGHTGEHVVTCPACSGSGTKKLNATTESSGQASPSATKCASCPALLNEGEAKTFTVCDDCWNKQYRASPDAEASDG